MHLKRKSFYNSQSTADVGTQKQIFQQQIWSFMFHITCVDKFKLLSVNPNTQPDITANTDKVSKPFLLQ